MTTLTFIRADQKDAYLVAKILTEATQFKLKHDDTAWGVDPYTDNEAEGLIDLCPTYLVYRDSEVVGTVSLAWEDESIWGKQPADAGYMHRLAVRDGMNGQGYGEQIIAWAKAETKANNRKYLRLDCPANNERLCKYYEKHGFKRIGTKTVDEHGVALYETVVTDKRAPKTQKPRGKRIILIALCSALLLASWAFLGRQWMLYADYQCSRTPPGSEAQQQNRTGYTSDLSLAPPFYTCTYK